MRGKFDRTAYQREYMRARRASRAQTKSQYVIYAVVLREHPHLVKLGQTCAWGTRRRQYDHWNFSGGDGVLESAIYCITEEYTDLRATEAACLSAMSAPAAHGAEWFTASLSAARSAIERTLQRLGLSYIELA